MTLYENLSNIPAPGTPAYNPAWYSWSDIWFDPVGGSDSNVGGSMGAPAAGLKTMAEVVRRYGSATPAITTGQGLKVHQVSAQTPGTDLFSFSPRMANGNFVWDGTLGLTALGVPFSPAAVIVMVRGTPGVLWQMTGMPAGSAAGDLVHNVTRDSWAWINSMAGAVATMTQPFTNASLTAIGPGAPFVRDLGWVNTDTYQRYSVPACNYQGCQPAGGASDAAYTTPTTWIQFIKVVDQSGVGNDTFAPGPLEAMNMIFSTCWIDPYFSFNGFDGSYFTVDGNCFSPNSSRHNFSSMVGGSTNSYKTGLNPLELWNFCGVDGDALLYGTPYVKGGIYNVWGFAYVDVGAVVARGTLVLEPFLYGGSQLWGAGTVNVEGPGAVMNLTGGTFAACLTVTALQLDGVATGSSFTTGAAGNPYTPGIAITSANLDTGGGVGDPGLQNPRTGSRYAST